MKKLSFILLLFISLAGYSQGPNGTMSRYGHWWFENIYLNLTGGKLLWVNSSTKKVEEVTLGTNLSFTGSTLNAAGGGTTYTAGAGIDITGTVISATTGNAPSLVTVNNSNYTIAAGVTHVLYNGTFTANRTLTLPNPIGNANRVIIIKHGGDGGFNINLSMNVKLATSGSFTNAVLPAEGMMIMSDGTDWWVLGNM